VGRRAEAQADCARALEADASYVEAWLLRAELALEAGDREGAREAAREGRRRVRAGGHLLPPREERLRALEAELGP
jgi:Tfp pilus assembly protein PilF